MSGISRRDFVKLAGGLGAFGALGAIGAVPSALAGIEKNARVVVIGGGFGGATCAKYLRRLDPAVAVTLVERDTVYRTCPFSNLVLGGLRDMDAIRHGYDGLREQYGIEVVHADAIGVDPVGRQVTLADGVILDYDRLVMAPGIDMRWDAVEGYAEQAAAAMPHAWKAGAQTELLRSQIVAMPDGGTVIIAAPGDPFRCPPGPYERASLIAHYLKKHKPRSKVLILDAKDTFSKQGLFTQAWQALYPGMIEWVAGSEGGLVERVDPDTRTLYAGFGFPDHQGEVVNFIPPQQAGEIARQADLVDETGWCPVDQMSFASTRHEGIHVIGDACVAGTMPRSAFSANSQAKVCAAAIVAALRGSPLATPSYANTCYSLVGPEYGISISAVYRLSGGQIQAVEGAGGVSPADVAPEFRRQEAVYAEGWYASIVADTFG